MYFEKYDDVDFTRRVLFMRRKGVFGGDIIIKYLEEHKWSLVSSR